MPLTIYRRHSADCKVFDLNLSPKAIRFYQDCSCRIWISGSTDTQRLPRQALRTRDWKSAEAEVQALTAGGKDATVHGLMLQECIQKFLDAHQANVGTKALGQHKLVLDRLAAFAQARNKFFLRDLDTDLYEDFKTYGLVGLKSTSKSTLVAKLKFFLREAYRRGWTLEAYAEKVKSTRAVYTQKQPYTEEEVSAILEQAAKLDGGTSGYATNAQTFRLLLDLMLETGVRVGDAIRYDPRRCTKSEHLWVYSFRPGKQRKAEKAKQHEVFLSERLKLSIDGCDWFSKHLPFIYRDLDDSTAMEAAVYERMQAIGERCGVADCRPHRLRDTFAVRLLLKGIALEDVSRLLGHASIAVTERYYAAWVPSRKLRLEGLLAKTVMNSGGY
ncbi:MAG: tyrosine-type recombinase/integrase [Bryobacteraceae bacterium]|jgi:integrase